MSDSFVSSEQCLKNFIAGEKEKAEWLLPQVEEPQLLRDEEYGRTLLHWASRWGWLDTMVTLIEHYSCDPMSRSNNGSVPLHLACFYTNNIDMINYLIEKCKCDPTLYRRDGGLTPLHCACGGGNVTLAKYLIKHYNCDPMCKADGGYTPLHTACYNRGNLNVISYLIDECKCDPMCRGDDGHTPLHCACGGGNVTLAKYLTTNYKCDPMCKADNGYTPLHAACSNCGNLDVISYLIDECKCDPMCRCDDGRTPLHSACSGGNVTLAKYLITHYNCDPMCKADGGYTPLHTACYNRGNLDVISYLIDECKCDPMCRRDDGHTPLHSACGGGNVILAKCLIKDYNCDPMCKADGGYTPLHIACYNRGNLDVLSYLIDECKCDPMCRSNDGRTPLHSACGEGNVTLAKYLIEHYNCDPMCRSDGGYTPLHAACYNRNNLDVIHYLIQDCKCDPMCRGNDGKTLLHMACANGSLDIVKYLILECKMDPLCKDKNLLTPLHVSCSNYHYGVADYLLCACVANPTSGIFSFVNKSKDNNLKLLFHKFSKLNSCRTVDAYTKVFVLGDPEVGKSTLTKVVKLRSNSKFIFGQYRLVSGVELHTAGIIPHRLEHRELGNIILHDLAGQPEYYSSHIAVLESITQGSAAVFIVVVKLSEEAPYKWLSIVKDLSSRCSSTCYLLTVASHADSVEGGEVRRRELAQKLEGKVTIFLKDESRLQNMRVVYLDCRKLDSEQFSIFKGFLFEACQAVQKDSSTMCVEHKEVLYCRMVYFLMETNGKDIYTIDELQRMISESNNFYCLPETDDQLVLTLYSLHCIGLIMFITTPGCSWIVFRKHILLTEVTGKMFCLKEFQASLASNTGIVSKKSLCENFAQYDPEMLVEFLLSVKLCDKITHTMMETTNLSPKDTDNAENELFFFPALMSYNKRPVMSFDMDSNERVDDDNIVLDKPFQFGWHLQCSNKHSFLSPRFLHLLIFRLAYQYSLPKLPHNPHDLRCTIWSTGILWNSEYGVKTLVELVNDSQSVILLMSSQKELEHNMISLRRRVIIDVLSIREEICPSVHVKEYIIDPSQLDYPIDEPSSLVLYDIEGIALCIAQNKPCVVSYTKNCRGEYDSKRLKDLLPLEYDRGQDMSIFVGRDIETLKLPGGLKLPNTVLSSPVGILRKYSAVIQDVMSDPERLAITLYSAELISSSVKDEVVTTPGLSRYRKASLVVSEIERNMSGTNEMEKFSRLCEVMKAQNDQPLCEIVIKMEKEVDSSYDQRRKE